MFPGEYGYSYLNDLKEIPDAVNQTNGQLTIREAVTLSLDLFSSLFDLSINLANRDLSASSKENIAKKYNCSLSYLKLPFPEGMSKRGGGIRVKRVLMYDAGIEFGDAAIYGNEYIYKTQLKVKDANNKMVSIDISSGVATNEPMALREENPLVNYIPKKSQTWMSRHIVGTNKESSEGPIGESILPGPSVGYSKVKVKNIHSGKTGTGYTVFEYNTVKDYPFDKAYYFDKDDPQGHFEDPGKCVDYTDLESNTQHDNLNIPAGIINFKTSKVWASQGYKFVISEFHGLLKSENAYDENNNLVYSMSKEYFKPGEQVRVMKGDNKNNNTWEWMNPGKEMDVSIEDKSVTTTSLDFQVELDISIGLASPPPPFFSFGFSFSYNENMLCTHVASKIIKYPVIEKSTMVYKDGIKSKVENLAFDFATGNPVLTKTSNIYDNIPISNVIASETSLDGSIYSFNIPAHWMYNSMGRKSENLSNMNDLKSSAGSIVSYGPKGVEEYNLYPANTVNPPYTWNFPEYPATTPTNVGLCCVLSASATTYANALQVTGWFDRKLFDDYYFPENCKDCNLAFQGQYRPYQTYVYKTDVTNKIDDNCKIYEEGLYKQFTKFDYNFGESNTKEWLKISEITKYSPSGIPVEEKDILGTYSSALYGENYLFSQPIMIAQNAQRCEIKFFDFENFNVDFPSHSGASSSPQGKSFLFTPTEHMKSKGGVLYFWGTGKNASDYTVTLGSSPVSINKIAQTGEWSLFKAELKFDNTSETTISVSPASGKYIDDLRLQPTDAKAVCYVYDKATLKLLTQFDDQHFGLFYQYNAEGQLVRKMVETEKGMKTLQETQYNIIKSTVRPSLN